MNIFLPVAAAVLQAASFTLDKVVLSLRGITFRNYTGASFPLIFALTLGLFLYFQPPFETQLLSGSNGILLFLSIALAIGSNIIFYRALDRDTLGEIQILELAAAIPIVLFSSIIFSDERNPAIILPALIASLAIVWSHWEKHHFTIARTTLPLAIWIVTIAPIAAALSKRLLMEWNPISLELVRSGIMALIIAPLFRKDAKQISLRAFGLLLATNFLTTIAWLLFYFSYQRSGIVYTILIFSLQPLLVYFASLIFLREKIHIKKVAAFCIVLLSIAVVQIIQ